MTPPEAWANYLRATYARGCPLIPAPVKAIQRAYRSDELEEVNHFLERAFCGQAIVTRKGLSDHFERYKLDGFFLPQSLLGDSLLEHQKALEALVVQHLKFDWGSYLNRVYNRVTDRTQAPAGVGPIAIYHFICDYLRTCGRERNGVWVIPRMSAGALASRPFVFQFVEVALMAARTRTGRHETVLDLKAFIATASAELQDFWRTYGGALNTLLDATDTQQIDLATETTRGDMQQVFYERCAADAHDLAAAQLIRPENHMHLNQDLRSKIEAQRADEARRDVFSRIANYSGDVAVETSVPPAPKHLLHYYGLTDDLRNALRNIAVPTADDPQQSDAEKERLLAWKEHLLALLKHLTEPALAWRLRDHLCIPYVPKASVPDPAQAHADFVGEMEQETRDLKVLKERIQQLELKTREESIAEIERDVQFKSRLAQQRWARAIKRRRHEMSKQDDFRYRKAIEYGLYEVEGLGDYERALYLEELISIEREVTPYIPFVQGAFRAALPVRETVAFSSQRHAVDGPEFDPETLSQPDKYLRGEVMKTFRPRRRTEAVTQINALCLDYSQSMVNEPMRHLFMIVFLILLGLEDRRSFDAVYFFGGNFIPVVDFSTDYDTRKVLLRILLMVSSVNGNSIWYKGVGLTNISAGVGESHRRILEFAEEMQARHPDMHIVRSLFVVTDGIPTAGIFRPDQLRHYIEELRAEGPVAIKGIYLDTGDRNAGEVVTEIFRPEHAVETREFGDAVVTFVDTMTRTYKAQRAAFRAAR